MKKVFALVLVAVLALSAAAFAEETTGSEFAASVTAGPEVIESSTKVELEVNETTEQMAAQIGEAEDLNNVFGTSGTDVTGYTLTELVEIRLPEYEGTDLVTILIKFDSSFAGKDIIVMLGLISEENQVTWQVVESVVEGDYVRVTVTAEQAEAIKNGRAVLAVLAK